MVDPDSPEGRGDAAAVNPAALPGNRSTLDTRRILGAAVDLIDDTGLREFTMAKLGDRLDVKAMAIYHHVPGRDALLDGVVEVVVDELYGDPDVHLSGSDWREYLYRLAHGVRRIALAHPQVFPLVATRPPAAPWVKPPLRSLRWIESFLGTLHDCGFSDHATVAAYQSFCSFLLGHLLLEVSAKGADLGPIDDPDPGTPDDSDLDAYPLLKALTNKLAENRSAEEFDDALAALLDRLAEQGKR